VASLASCVGRPHVWRTTAVADKAGSAAALDAGRMVNPLPIARKRLNGASELQRAHTRRIRIHRAEQRERAKLILRSPSGRRRGGRGDRRRLPALGPLARAALLRRFRHALALKLNLRRSRVLGKPVATGCGCVVDESQGENASSGREPDQPPTCRRHRSTAGPPTRQREFGAGIFVEKSHVHTAGSIPHTGSVMTSCTMSNKLP
jgi:hypothetical protein